MVRGQVLLSVSKWFPPHITCSCAIKRDSRSVGFRWGWEGMERLSIIFNINRNPASSRTCLLVWINFQIEHKLSFLPPKLCCLGKRFLSQKLGRQFYREATFPFSSLLIFTLCSVWHRIGSPHSSSISFKASAQRPHTLRLCSTLQ